MAIAERISVILFRRVKITAHQFIASIDRNLSRRASAVFDAYGWPADLPDEEILARLIALNAERAQEETQDNICWLRPEYQTKTRAERQAVQTALDLLQAPEPAPKGKKSAWPASLLEQTQAVRGAMEALRHADTAITMDAVAARFIRASRTIHPAIKH
ncbi:MAG: hypothetical protein FWC58_00745 [Desulfobulbus sp.]|nr:hypothetical protein [Desulfobulbus sp.]